MRHVSNAIMEVSRSRENAHAVLLVERFDGGRFAERPDFVVQEVSIEVFLDGRPTFRGTCSPWDVEDLVVGRLFLEGAIVEMDDVVSIEVDLEGGRVDVLTRPRGRRTGDGCVIVPFGSLPGRAPAGVPVAARPLSDMQVAAATVNAAIALLERQSLLFRKRAVCTVLLWPTCVVACWLGARISADTAPWISSSAGACALASVRPSVWCCSVGVCR